MIKRSKNFETAIVLMFVVTITGCATTTELTARLYNLNDGTIIKAYLNTFSKGHGRMAADLSGGEKLTGEFTIIEIDRRASEVRLPMEMGLVPSAGESTVESGEEGAGKQSKSLREVEQNSWFQVYGFGPASDAKPVGTATLIGDKGTVLEIVLYSINLRSGFGNGVGRDNKGNWYRVYIGELN